MTFASGFCVAWNTRYGLGKHVYFLGPEEIKLYLRVRLVLSAHDAESLISNADRRFTYRSCFTTQRCLPPN